MRDVLFVGSDVWLYIIMIVFYPSFDLLSLLNLAQSCKLIRQWVLWFLRKFNFKNFDDHVRTGVDYWKTLQEFEKLKKPHTEKSSSKFEDDSLFMTQFTKKYYECIIERKLGSKSSVMQWKRPDFMGIGGYYILGKHGSEELKQNPSEEYLVSHWTWDTLSFWCEQFNNESTHWDGNPWESQYSEFIESKWNPNIEQNLSQMLSSGNHVPFTDELLSFLSHIVPESDYVISSFVDVPKFPAEDPDYFINKRRKDLKLPEKSSFSDRLTFPGIFGKWEGSAQIGWVFRNLHLNAVPLHQVWDQERVEYYKNKIMENNISSSHINFDTENMDVFSTLQSRMHLEGYIPTILVLCPKTNHWYVLGGLILDGHHKLQAAAEMGSPIRVILIEEKLQRCSCVACEESSLNFPLLWACERNSCIENWTKKWATFRIYKRWCSTEEERAFFKRKSHLKKLYKDFIDNEFMDYTEVTIKSKRTKRLHRKPKRKIKRNQKSSLVLSYPDLHIKLKVHQYH